MAWLEWIRRLLGQKPASNRGADRQQQAATCPRCGRRLRSHRARQCMICGASWHRLDESAALSSRRCLADDWSFTSRSASAPITPATARLLETSWGPELLPPATTREALDLGALAPPASKSARRTAQRNRPAAAKTEDTARPSKPARSHATWLYLGRGVSRHLSECTSDTARLAELELPELHTADDVATAIGIEPHRLRWLCWHAAANCRVPPLRLGTSKAM